MNQTSITEAVPQSASSRDRIGRPIQETLLALLIYNDTHGGVVAKAGIAGDVRWRLSDIARRVGSYWKEYGRAPGRQVDDLFADVLTERTGRDVTYGDLFIHLLEMHQDDNINVEFIQDEIRKFKQLQAAKRLLVDSAEKVHAYGEAALEDFDRAIDAYREASRKPPDTNSVVQFGDFSFWAGRAELARKYTSGITALDNARIIPQPGTLTVINGGSGDGKSQALLHYAMANLVVRNAVLYFTLEMSKEAVHRRAWQRVLAGTHRS